MFQYLSSSVDSLVAIFPNFHRRPSWNVSFTATVKILRATAFNLPKNVTSIRYITDNAIPTWMPTLPSGVSCNYNESGEWFYPTAKTESMRRFNTSTRIENSRNKYILYFHGGAFCVCGTSTHRGILYRLTDLTEAFIFAVDYRRPPEYPYPLPVEDCLKSYKWLLEHVDASQIIFAGDSAGANLIIFTILQAHALNLPLPSGCVLLSPWVDLEDVGHSDSWIRNESYDYLPRELAFLFAESYRGNAASYDALSPIKLSQEQLSILPPLLIECGECEVLVDQILAFAAKCVAANVVVDVNVRSDMIHVFQLFCFTGMQQCLASFDSIASFVNRRTISV